MTDKILHWVEGNVDGLSNSVFINVMYWIKVVLAFFVPSTSSHTVLSMPVLAPVGDLAEIERSLIANAFQFATAVVNLVTSTSAVTWAVSRLPASL